MIIAQSTTTQGRTLILGLTEENIARLRNDQPIRKNLGAEGVPGLEDWTLYILGPEDSVRFIAAVNPTDIIDDRKETGDQDDEGRQRDQGGAP